MKNCRVCQHAVSEQAYICPNCGTPYSIKSKWDGWSIEYKSSTMILGIPLLHISFKYRSNFIPITTRGVIAIGQFGAGIVIFLNAVLGSSVSGSSVWAAGCSPSHRGLCHHYPNRALLRRGL